MTSPSASSGGYRSRRRSAMSGAAHEITLFERPGCHLCDEAATPLAALAEQLGLPLRRVNVEADPALEARYGLAVPVVAVNGVEVTRAPLDLVAVRAAVAPPMASTAVPSRIDRSKGRI